MDILDLMAGDTRQTYKGTYYTLLPEAVTAFDEPDIDQTRPRETAFRYEYATGSTRQRNYILPNVEETQNIDATIRTNQGAFMNVDGIVRLSDGLFYKIISVSQDMARASRYAAEFVPVPVGVDFIIRLTRIEEPWFAKFTEPIEDKTVIFPTGTQIT